MALDEVQSTKLRALLEALPPNMRATLARMIAEARKSGASDPVFDLLAGFLGDGVPEVSAAEPALSEPAMMPAPVAEQNATIKADEVFRAALAPFLIPETLSKKIPGRVCEQVLGTIWAWLSTDLAQPAVEAFSSSYTAGDDERRQTLLADIAQSMSKIVITARTNPDARRRYAGQVGGDRNFQEFEDVAVILGRSRELGRFSAILSEGDSASEAALFPLLARAIVELGRIDQRLPFHAAVIIAARLGAASKLAKIAVAGAGSDDPKAIASSPFAALVEVALAETERSAIRVNDNLKQLKSDGTLSPALRDFAMSSRNLRAVLNLDQANHDWTRRLTEMRTRLSEGIARELNELPRLIRASIKSLRAFDQRRLGVPDAVDVERTCVLIELLNAAKLSSTELGVNETVLRVFGDTDTYLDHTSRIIVEDARNALGDQRNTVRAFGDAAIRMTELLHGSGRAAALRRSLASVSSQGEPALRLAR